MKKVIISIYVAAVVAISLLAQASFAASPVELKGTYVVLSEDGSKLMLLGRYPNPCTTNAQVKFTQNFAGALELKVVAETRTDACVAVLGESFKVIMPVGALKAKLTGLSIDPNGIYMVKTADGRFNKEIDFSKVSEATEATGELTTMIKVNVAKNPGVQLAL